MSPLILITAIYVAGGLALAVLMFLTAMRVSDVGKATGQVLKLVIGKVEIDTSSILVALGVVSFAAMVGIPAYYLYLNRNFDNHPMQLVVRFNPPPNAEIQVTSDASHLVESNSILRVYRSGDLQSFTVGTKNAQLPLVVWYDNDTGRPYYTFQYNVKQPVADFHGDSGTIELPFVQLTPPPNTTSADRADAAVPANLRALPDPSNIRSLQAAQAVAKPENS